MTFGWPRPQILHACNSVVLLCSLWVGLSSREWHLRVAALLSAAGSVASSSLIWKSRSAFPSSSMDSSSMGSGGASLPGHPLDRMGPYSFAWNINGDATERVFNGEATVFRFGDRLLVRQVDNNASGTYLMDLKCLDNSRVSGVWWHYGANLPHGTYIGSISADQRAIDGMWQGPGGQGSGQWTLKAITDQDPETSESAG